MNKKYLTYGIILGLFVLKSIDSRYKQIDDVLPKDKTVIENDSLKIEENYDPSLFLGLIPFSKRDTSYSATFTKNCKARDGYNHPFNFKDVNIKDIFSYNPDKSRLRGLDKKSDSCYRLLGDAINKEYSESFRNTIEDLLVNQ